MDSRTQRALLGDNTFCSSVTGVPLDMVMAGRWQAEGSKVRLQQLTQDDQTLFPAYARKMVALGIMVEEAPGKPAVVKVMQYRRGPALKKARPGPRNH